MSNGNSLVIICCVCHKIKSGTNWEYEQKTHGCEYTHSFCPDCYETELTKLKQFKMKPLEEVVPINV